jgi:hypothetical protein
MSGILGLIETDILFAESGTSQPEFWRIAQGTLGIGALRVMSRVCKTPCFEQLHQMYGIKPPESMQAREFWLRQEAWTELQGLDMGQEDTSYHRINQGSGPQGKLLYDWEEIETERKRWGSHDEDPSNIPVKRRSQDSTDRPKEGWVGVNTSLSVAGQKGEEISQGSTDKWWMDRWQIEALAVASGQELTLENACNLLTTAYFGPPTGHLHHLISGIVCGLLTVGTFVAAWYTNWSWVIQFFALSSLGYFVNWTSSLRGWQFMASPDPLVRNFRPRISKSWPTKDEVADGAALRIAVQSSGTVHLRGLILIPKPLLDAAKQVAISRRGRYKSNQNLNKRESLPYSNTRSDKHWISFESQASFYGLLVTVEPDNVARRSLGVIWAMVDGLLLLILGFGASTPDDWSKYVLIIYIIGIIVAICGRNRDSVWTLPEFKKVDFTVKPVIVPPTMRPRIVDMEFPKPLAIAEVRVLVAIFVEGKRYLPIPG